MKRGRMYPGLALAWREYKQREYERWIMSYYKLVWSRPSVNARITGIQA